MANPAFRGVRGNPRQGLQTLGSQNPLYTQPWPRVNMGYPPVRRLGPVIPMMRPQTAATPQVTPQQVAGVQPATRGGLLGNQQALGAGLLGAAGQFAKAAGPSAMPIRTGSVVGPALQQFAADYAKGQKEQLAAKKEQLAANAMAEAVREYGSAARLTGAIGPLIKERAAQQQFQYMQDIFRGGGSEEEKKVGVKTVLGTDLTEQEWGQTRAALATRDPKIANSTFTGIVNKKNERTTQFRKEFGDKIKNTSKIIRAAQQALRMLNANEGTGSVRGVDDLVTLYITITALDPESTVRTGEVDLGREIMSNIDQVRLKLERVSEARVLDKTLAADMRKLVLGLGQLAERSADEIETFYRDAAKTYALNPDLIISPRHKLPTFSAELLKKSRLLEEGAFR